jgi:3-methyl-2-oxobutanoate hydroxymethyltransferase
MADKVTVKTLAAMKGKEKAAMVTAYDFPGALLADAAGADVVLVGDSLAMVVLGYDSTLPVTMEEMLHHTRAVRRGVTRAMLVADMPFGSYQGSRREAFASAARFMKEAGAEAVKLEGGETMAPTIEHLVRRGVPVMGHVGLTPQSVHQMGGYRVQGRGEEAFGRLLADARAVERAGVFAVVLEGIPAAAGKRITRELAIPTIGIGAGAGCDGQVLVFHDLLGMGRGPAPKFVKRFAEAGRVMETGLRRFVAEVKSGKFPGRAQSYE